MNELWDAHTISLVYCGNPEESDVSEWVIHVKGLQ